MLRKKWLIALLLLVSVLGMTYVFKHHHKILAQTKDAILVEVAQVTQGDIPIESHAVGTLVAAKNIQITPEVAGIVSQVLFKDGAFVKRGTPLIQFDDAVYKAKLQSTRADLIYSEANYKRMVLLGKHGAVAKQAIDQAAADLQEKKAAAEESQVMVNKMLLNAPFDGVLGKCGVSPGTYVTVGQGLVSLTDIYHLRAEYALAEKYLASLKLGQAVTITTSAFPGRAFKGWVSFISPTINVSDRTIALYAEVPNENGLLVPGLFVNVIQSLGQEKQALLVPSTSLMPTIDGQQVFKMIHNQVFARSVIVGQRTMDNVQILAGLSAGDGIVIAGQQKLKDGMQVEVKK